MPKERFDELNVAEHDRYGKGSVVVWKGINVNGKTDLYAIGNGTLTALRYFNEISISLRGHMRVLSVKNLF